MKPLLQITATIALFFCSHFCFAQNVGINKTNPTEKLDVNGSINLSNQLKINGDSGNVNQVLMKNAFNNLFWGDLTEYKNSIQYNCSNTNTNVAANCSYNWTVPANVTTVFVECWGGGGGGCSGSGGGSGGYISAKFPVSSGQVLAISVGSGGYYGSNTINGYTGGQSSALVAGNSVTATGGLGGASGDMINANSLNISPSQGGQFSVSGLVKDFYGLKGNYGVATKISLIPVGVNEYAKKIEFGNGGDAVFFPNSGSKGGNSLVSTTYNIHTNAAVYADKPGGGGGADAGDGYYGSPGMVVIRW